MSWQDDYRKRVAELLVPVHAEHGFQVEPQWEGMDGGGCPTCGYDVATVNITVSGECPCGKSAFGGVWGPEDVADFMRRLTDG